MKSLISLNNVSKQFDKQTIFDKFSLDIYESEILVILGSSGIGKSTLLNMLSKVDEDYSGEISYEESVSLPLPVVFQEFDQLFPWFTVKKNILLPYKNKESELENIVEATGLSDSLNKYPVQLSGGMKQRTAIARALISDSKIIFMDEPFGSLDSTMRRNLQILIKKINKEFDKTIVFITHDLEEARFIGHRILTLSENGYKIEKN